MRSGKLAGLAAAASLLALASAANASTTWTFSGPVADGSGDATAVIDVTSTGLTVDLTSNLASPTSDGGEVSGIQIFFDHLPTTVGNPTVTGTLINIASGGAVTASAATVDQWGTALSGGSLYLAAAGIGSTGGKPHDLIIGPGPYTNANSSITKKNPHIQGTGEFVLTFTGLTEAPTITGVNLAFGTTGTDYHEATCSDCSIQPPPPPPGVPEPASWMTMIMGMGAVGAFMRRRRAVFA